MRLPLILSYNNESAIDGFGAQAIRLAGIYGIAKALHCNYLHCPVLQVPREELSRFPVSDHEYQRCLEMFNKVLLFKSANKAQDTRKVLLYKEKSIWLKKLAKYIFLSFISGKRVHLKLTLPQGITDKFPFILENIGPCLKENLLKFGEKETPNSTVVHIRAEHHGPNKRRPHLSPNYYKACLDNLIAENLIDRSQPLVIHTDFFSEDFTEKTLEWRPSLFSEFFRELKDIFPLVQFKHYAPIGETLLDMFHATTLVMSRSSISYFAGIVNQNHVIWPPSHGHAKLPRWLIGPDLRERGIFIGGMKSPEED